MAASFIKTDDHITIVFDDGESVTIFTTAAAYAGVIAAIREGNWDKVRDLAIPSTEIKREIKEEREDDRVKVVGGIVTLDGQELHNTLTERLLSMMKDGFDVGPMSKFLVNLMKNPSYRAVNELYSFMEQSDLPITEDGHFIAYKRVRMDWKDEWSGKIDNSIGQVVTMPRNRVNEDSHNLCSKGLHFCSRDYLPSYGSTSGGRLIIIKINPRDIVAIPQDYNNSKGRCCRYEVIGELTKTDNSDYTLPKEELEGAFHVTETPESKPSFSATPSDGSSSKTGAKKASTTTPTETTRAVKKRKVAQIDPESNIVIKTFNSVAEAYTATFANESSIRKVCNGQRNKAGGYKWAWVDTSNDSADNVQHDQKPFTQTPSSPSLISDWDPLYDGDNLDDHEEDDRW